MAKNETPEVAENGTIEITAKKDDLSCAVTYDFGHDLESMVAMFGSDVVFTNARQSMKITAQAAMRRLLKNGKTQDEIQKIIAAWKPGVQIERTVDPIATFKNKFAGMDEEAKKALIAELKGQL